MRGVRRRRRCWYVYIFRRAFRKKQIQMIADIRSTMKNLALVTRDLYYFYERNTGVFRFQVEATPDGRFPVDQAAGLLAVHCMVLGQSPSDYPVMVSAQNDPLKRLIK